MCCLVFVGDGLCPSPTVHLSWFWALKEKIAALIAAISLISHK
ncbi:MAG: hypothetical protein WDA53_08655 [Bacillota bacterium]